MSSKLREALEEVNLKLRRWQFKLPSYAWVDVESTIRKSEAALAEPVRNYEVGTAVCRQNTAMTISPR